MFFYDLERRVKKKIARYSSNIPIQEVKILVAYSGGVDSSVLLHIINKLSIEMNFQYDFVYINHSMNQNANHIVSFAKYFSKKNNVNFIYDEIIDKPKKNKESFFRSFRYKYFNDLVDKGEYNFIFTAHHYNDQIETLYMRTIGRYDWTNLLGVREFNKFVRRPLIQTNKKNIISYAINSGIPWFFDNTNNDNNNKRNEVRNIILVNKNIFNKIFLMLLHNFSKIKFYFFNKKIKQLKKEIIVKEEPFIILNKYQFLKLNKGYKKVFLQNILKKYNDNHFLINKNTKWSSLWNYLNKNKNLKDFTLNENIIINNSKDLIIIREKGSYKRKISLVDNAVWNNFIFKIEYQSDDIDINKNCFYICRDLFIKGLFIRNWNVGDFYKNKKDEKKRVSRLFLKNKFNNYAKMIYPLVVDSNDQILWIPGLENNFNQSGKFSKNNCIKISKEILN